jgi:hypothetical protein
LGRYATKRPRDNPYATATDVRNDS